MSSWKTTDIEDVSVNGGEIIFIENETGNGNNWMSLTTIKTWLATFFAPLLGADDNYVTDAEKIVIGNTSGTNTGDNAANSNYSSLVTMTYPGAGIPVSTGSAWGTSISASANGQSLIAAADYAAMRTLLDLEPDTDFSPVGKNLVITKYTAVAYTVGTTSANEAYGGIIYVTGTATISLPAIASGMSVSIIADAAVVVTVDPNGSEIIRKDGIDGSAGATIASTGTIGDVCVLTYHSSGKWFASTNGW